MTSSIRRARIVNHSIVYLILMAGAVVMLLPLLWTVSTSLKTLDQLVVTRIELIPNPVAWKNYVELFRIAPVLLNFRNTMFIVVAAEFGSLVMCSLVAYGFARMPFPGRGVPALVEHDDAARSGYIDPFLRDVRSTGMDQHLLAAHFSTVPGT